MHPIPFYNTIPLNQRCWEQRCGREGFKRSLYVTERLPTALLGWERRGTVTPPPNKTWLIDLGHRLCSVFWSSRGVRLSSKHTRIKELLVCAACCLLPQKIKYLRVGLLAVKACSSLADWQMLFHTSTGVLPAEIPQDSSQIQAATSWNSGCPWSAKQFLQTDTRHLGWVEFSFPCKRAPILV